MAPPKLTYFNMRGLGEPVRFILKYADEEFIDERIAGEEWPAVKPTTPYGKLPMIEIDGIVIAQSCAICRYYAKKHGLAGKDDFEAMLIDATVDALNDLRTAIANVLFETDETVKKKKYEQLAKETVPFYSEKLEKQVKDNNGCFVNGKLSWADLYFAAFADSMSYLAKQDLVESYPHLRALKEKVEALPAVKAWIAQRPESEY